MTSYEGPLRDVLRGGRFGHAQHVELVWRYLQDSTVPEAETRTCAAIRDVAARHGTPGKYHETLTRAWVRVVAAHHREPGEPFDTFAQRFPRLLDQSLVAQHYSPQRLWSEAAREHWEEPDLQPLP